MEAELTDGGGTIVYANNIPGTPPAMPLFSQVAWAGDTAYLDNFETWPVTVTLKKGTYEFYCPVSGHKAAGMKGRIVVR